MPASPGRPPSPASPGMMTIDTRARPLPVEMAPRLGKPRPRRGAPSTRGGTSSTRLSSARASISRGPALLWLCQDWLLHTACDRSGLWLVLPPAGTWDYEEHGPVRAAGGHRPPPVRHIYASRCHLAITSLLLRGHARLLKSLPVWHAACMQCKRGQATFKFENLFSSVVFIGLIGDECSCSSRGLSADRLWSVAGGGWNLIEQASLPGSRHCSPDRARACPQSCCCAKQRARFSTAVPVLFCSVCRRPEPWPPSPSFFRASGKAAPHQSPPVTFSFPFFALTLLHLTCTPATFSSTGTKPVTRPPQRPSPLQPHGTVRAD